MSASRSLGPREGRVSHINTQSPSHKTRHADGTQLAIETEHIVDVSSVLQLRDNYKKGDYVVYKTKLDDLEINAEFYPQGMQKSKPNYCAFFITIPNVNDQDRRKLSCRIGSVYELFDESFNPVNIWKSGRGYSSFATIDHLEHDPQIPVKLKLYLNANYIATTKKSFQSQLHKMYLLSQKNGDVLLSVIANGTHRNRNMNTEGQLNPDTDSAFGEPPTKKRKLNEPNHPNHHPNRDANDTEEGAEHQTSTSPQNMTHGLRVSSLILQSGSKVFEQMFSTEMMEKSSGTITVYANSVQDVDDMIYFMATDILRKCADAHGVLKLAHFYQIDRLIMACLNRMIECLTVDTFVSVVTTFDRYSIEHGYGNLVKFGRTHCDEIRNREDYSKLTHCFKCVVLGAARD